MGPLVLALLVATASSSPDAGIAPDAPVITKLADDRGYLFSPKAFDAVNAEMKRLQESEAKAVKTAKESQPPWVQVVLVSAAVGLVVGAPAGFLLGRALPR